MEHDRREIGRKGVPFDFPVIRLGAGHARHEAACGQADDLQRRGHGISPDCAPLNPVLEQSAQRVAAITAAAEAEGVPFALNARTDAFVRAGDRPVEESIADAIERGRAFLDAGATCVFVPGVLNADVTTQLVEGIGRGKISVIGLPGALKAADYEGLGVARISYGPLTQRVALTALQDVASDLYADGVIPSGTRALN